MLTNIWKMKGKHTSSIISLYTMFCSNSFRLDQFLYYKIQDVWLILTCSSIHLTVASTFLISMEMKGMFISLIWTSEAGQNIMSIFSLNIIYASMEILFLGESEMILFLIIVVFLMKKLLNLLTRRSSEVKVLCFPLNFLSRSKSVKIRSFLSLCVDFFSKSEHSD